MKLFTGLFFLVTLVAGCKTREDAIIANFDRNKALFYKFVKAAQDDPVLLANLNKLTDVTILSASTREMLTKLNLGKTIDYIVLTNQQCPDSKEYSIEITFGKWQIEYHPCGMIDLQPGQHKNVGDLIESWGLDSCWLLWVNRDFIG